VVLERIQEVERVFGRLPTGEGAQLEHQERPNLTNANWDALLSAEKIHAADYLLARSRERTIDPWQNIRRDIVHHDHPFCSRRSLNKEIQVDRIRSNAAFEAALECFARAKPLAL